MDNTDFPRKKKGSVVGDGVDEGADMSGACGGGGVRGKVGKWLKSQTLDGWMNP